MNVFIPSHILAKNTIEILDHVRLRNQVLRECMTLLRGGWPNHPVAKAWVNNHGALALYTTYGLYYLYRHRLIQHGAFFRLRGELNTIICASHNSVKLPSWWGDKRIHSSHRACLLAKGERDYYKLCAICDGASPNGWTEDTYHAARDKYPAPKPPQNYYRKFGWSEEPTWPDKNGKWPYVWPEV